MKKRIICMLIVCIAAINGLTSCKNETSAREDNIEIIKGGVEIKDHPLEATTAGEISCTGEFPEIILDEEYQKKLPNLWEKIQDQNNYWENYISETVEECGPYKIEGNYKQYDNLQIEVKRFDDRLFSILCRENMMFGENGEANWVYVYNFDVATGNSIDLSSVIIDKNAFGKIVREKLEDKYPEYKDTFGEPFKSQCGDEDPFVYKLDNLGYSWILTEKGLELYFLKDEITKSNDIMDVLIPYDEIKDLVQPVYNTDSTEYIDKLVTYKKTDCKTLTY